MIGLNECGRSGNGRSGLDEMGVDEVAVDELAIRRSGNWTNWGVDEHYKRQ